MNYAKLLNFIGLRRDAGGNLIANVTPRTGTLTSLLTTVAGGVGEVSYATDWDAAVKHNGVVGGAKILYCKPRRCILRAGAVDFVNNLITVITAGNLTVIEDVHGLYYAANNGVAVPADATHFRVNALAQFTGNATGRRVLRVCVNNTTDGYGFGGLFNNTLVSTASQSVGGDTGSVNIAEAEAYSSIALNYLNIAGFQDSGANLAFTTTQFPPVFSFEFWRES